MPEHIETVIIGGGQAGLSMSYYLSAIGREHVVLERTRVADAWRTQRWDSLCFQSPKWSMALPGHHYDGPAPESFAHRSEVVAFIEDYGRMIAAPLRTGVNVTRLEYEPRSVCHELTTSHGKLVAKNVVVATGPYQRARTPTFAAHIPGHIEQLHSASYRRPDLLPDGKVLVVGSGASGCQITEDLLDAGRHVFLSVSGHTRAPRRYRGADVFAWRYLLGQLDHIATTARDRARTGPLITGASGGHDIDLREFATRGATLIGRVTACVDGQLAIAADLDENLRRGDESLDTFKGAVDSYLRSVGSPPHSEPSANMVNSLRSPATLATPSRLGFDAERISCVIWATGYENAFEWIASPIFNGLGEPFHQRGVSEVPGLYFLGLPWLHKAKSSFLCGVGDDAEYLATRIARRLGKQSVTSVPRHSTCTGSTATEQRT